MIISDVLNILNFLIRTHEWHYMELKPSWVQHVAWMKQLLTSVKKLSIALVILILIPEDLQSGQSDSCVVSGIPGKIKKQERKEKKWIRSESFSPWCSVCRRTVSQSVWSYSRGFTLCFMGYSSSRLLLSPPGLLCAPPQRLHGLGPVRRSGVWVSRQTEAKKRGAGESLEILTQTWGQQSWSSSSSSSSCGPAVSLTPPAVSMRSWVEESVESRLQGENREVWLNIEKRQKRIRWD